MIRIYAAPMQGLTDASYRHWHYHLCGGCDCYYTPFVRIESGDVRQRDMRDILSPLNEGVPTAVQIIASDASEAELLVDAVAGAGYSRIDINMGCPHPPQTGRGRGAGLMARRDSIEGIADYINGRPDIRFSVKMRLGLTDNSLWQEIMPIINRMRLESVTIHARNARQQYRGETDLDSAVRLASSTEHPVIYNGDVTTLSDIDRISDTRVFAGVMIGRGLIGRPTLASEWLKGSELSSSERLEAFRMLHDKLLDNYSRTLSGEHQILSKIKPYWEYAEALIDRRAFKAIKKANSIESYMRAIN